MKNIITPEEHDWVIDVVDNHKRIRSETTRDRVKILMIAAMHKILERVTNEKNEKRRKFSKRSNKGIRKNTR